MAGGSGERFWPLSTPQRPKQLLKLTSPTDTMLQEAVSRIEPLVGSGNVYAAVSTTIQKPVQDSNVVPLENVWAEPTKRNTLGCLCWVSAQLLAVGDNDATVAVLTADHQIGKPHRFRETVRAAFELAEEKNALVTIGIPPDRPEIGYGYIEADYQAISVGSSGREGYRSVSFREKPDAFTAATFLEAGNFLWNSGMFFFPITAFLRELESAQPAARMTVNLIASALAKGDASEASQRFADLPSISVDFAVMEKAENVWVIPADFPWDDVGSWDSLARTFTPDAQGNVTQGSAALIDTRNSIVVNDSADLQVGVLGLEDVVVVATDGALLVCAKSHAQRVREITSELQSRSHL